MKFSLFILAHKFMKPMSDKRLGAFLDGCVGRKSPSALYAEGRNLTQGSS
jgi:hypothetical protein